MLPVGAFAVALFLNGLQIMLPAPAFVEQGHVYVPARAVLERLACKVTWDVASRTLTVQSGPRLARFPLVSSPVFSSKQPLGRFTAREVQGITYIPAAALATLGLQVSWNSAVRRLDVQQAVSGASLAAVLADPPAWAGREVTLSGEYLGWGPLATYYATRRLPPMANGAWILHNDDGAIYCAPAPLIQTLRTATLTAVEPSKPTLAPYSALGERLAVTGTVRLTPDGLPYLASASARRLIDKAGALCCLQPDALQVHCGEAVSWRVYCTEPLPATYRIHLTGNGLDYSVSLVAEARNQDSIWVLHGSMSLPQGVSAGKYALTVQFPDGRSSYAREFEAIAAEPIAIEEGQARVL